jgi:hypothetical protein
LKVWPDGVLRTRLLEVTVRSSSGWSVESLHDVDVKVPPLQGDERHGRDRAAPL